MAPLPRHQRLCARSPFIAATIVAFLLIPHANNSKVFDDRGAPVTLPNILYQTDAPAPSCLNDAALWQKWIEHKIRQRKGGVKIAAGYEKAALTFKEVSENFRCQDQRIFWQGALIQSILETGFYTFGGDANPETFNVAGVGITLKHVGTQGKEDAIQENFGNLKRGIKAYFQHLCVYATGYEVENPIATRTKLTQRDKAEKVQNWRSKDPQKNHRPITFNDLKAPLPTMDRNSPKFKNFARQFAGSVEGYKQYEKKLAGTGGTTFTWAGDPFYGVKMMSLWAEGIQWVENECKENATVVSEEALSNARKERCLFITGYMFNPKEETEFNILKAKSLRYGARRYVFTAAAMIPFNKTYPPHYDYDIYIKRARKNAEQIAAQGHEGLQYDFVERGDLNTLCDVMENQCETRSLFSRWGKLCGWPAGFGK
jgi:hypothetical protein